MSQRKHLRVGMGAIAAIVAVAVAVPALAAAPPAKVTQKIVGGTKFVPNRYVQEGVRFKLDRINIRNGGTVTLVNTTREDHTFSLVGKGQVPTRIGQLESCFDKGPCGKLAVEHGAINPDTGEEQKPTTPLVNAGKAGFNQAGDSIIVPPRKRRTIKVTSAQPLYYICIIHPWMSGAINAKPVR
jgi:plastocyanin